MDHAYAYNWSNLPNDDVLIAVVHRFSCIEDYFRFTTVCKSWKSATEIYKPLLPPKYPLLLLAVDVVPGLYSLSTGKTYILELPEASGRLILGANHGWLVTLGRDLDIHRLHPLLRYQVSLLPMLTLPKQYRYARNLTPEKLFDMFIHRVILSSNVPKKDGVNLHDSSSPSTTIVMVGYGQCGMYLALCRFGDEEWTHVEIQSRPIDDSVYHKG